MGRAAIAASLLLLHCGFNESPHRCAKNSECPVGQSCVFVPADGCTGRGRCALPTSTMACSDVACGCDGQPSFPVGSSSDIMAGACIGYDHPLVSTTPCH